MRPALLASAASAHALGSRTVLIGHEALDRQSERPNLLSMRLSTS